MPSRKAEPYLEILSDRGLLKIKRESRSATLPFQTVGRKKGEKRTYEVLHYRITNSGIKYVESDYQQPRKRGGYEVTIQNNPNAQIMVQSPGGTQMQQPINQEIVSLLIELRELIKDSSQSEEITELIDGLEDEIQQDKPRQTVLKAILGALKDYGPAFADIARQLLPKIIGSN